MHTTEIAGERFLTSRAPIIDSENCEEATFSPSSPIIYNMRTRIDLGFDVIQDISSMAFSLTNIWGGVCDYTMSIAGPGASFVELSASGDTLTLLKQTDASLVGQYTVDLVVSAVNYSTYVDPLVFSFNIHILSGTDGYGC